MSEALVIRVNGNEDTIQDLELDTLQKAVGGYIELVHIGGGKVLIVDEEGLIKQKPVNYRATEMSGRSIVGDVVLANYNDLD